MGCAGSRPEADSSIVLLPEPIGVAMHAEGLASVVLRDAPNCGQTVAVMLNGEHLKILRNEGDFVKVRWKEVEGWTEASNVQQPPPVASSGDREAEVLGDASGPHVAERVDGPQIAFKDAADLVDPVGYWEYESDAATWTPCTREESQQLDSARERSNWFSIVGADRVQTTTSFRRMVQTRSIKWPNCCPTCWPHGWPYTANRERSIRREASAKELVQKAQSMMQEHIQEPLDVGASKYTQPEHVLEILDRHWICKPCKTIFRAKLSRCSSCSQPPKDGSEAWPVKLISGSWLLAYVQDSERKCLQRGLPRRQDLEKTESSEALLSVVKCRTPLDSGTEGKVLNIVSISYCWCTAAHPDPDGRQLKLIAGALKSEREGKSKKKYSWTFKDVGIFLDFGSLHQRHRTNEEWLQFCEALREMGIWYAHAMIMTYLVTESPAPGIVYDCRGWTHFERSCAEMMKPAGAGGSQRTWRMIIDVGGESGGRQLPLTPESFAEELAQRQFTSRGDKETVVQLYTQTFMRVIRGIDVLDFSGFRLQPGDGAALASVLRHCLSVTALRLGSMGIDDHEMQAIGNALPSCPLLRQLYLYSNSIGDAGAKAIAEVLPKCPSLRNLLLSGNEIGENGAMAIAGVLPRCPWIRQVRLRMNKIETDAAKAVADASGGRFVL